MEKNKKVDRKKTFIRLKSWERKAMNRSIPWNSLKANVESQGDDYLIELCSEGSLADCLVYQE